MSIFILFQFAQFIIPYLLLFPCKLILISTASKRIFRFFKADKSHCFQTQKQWQNAANSVIKQAKKRPGTQVGICVPGLGHGSIFLSFVRGHTENHSVSRIAACVAWKKRRNQTLDCRNLSSLAYLLYYIIKKLIFQYVEQKKAPAKNEQEPLFTHII